MVQRQMQEWNQMNGFCKYGEPKINRNKEREVPTFEWGKKQ